MQTETDIKKDRLPTVLDDIQARLGKEISAMNGIISDELHTEHGVVNGIIDTYLVTKGKQIRPLLVMLSATMFGEITPNVLYSAAALEMLHNATLIHDDVVDDTSLRRGKPTLNAIWGNHIAVLSGDLFVSKALSIGVKTGNIKILEALSNLGTDLSLGEMDQLFNARGHHLDEQSYFEMIRRKTASLFSGCVRVGALAVDTAEERILPLESYANLLGLAFQIRDDIFDYFPSREIGKPTGNDLLEGKVTLPLIYALHHGPAIEAGKMRQLLTSDDPLTAPEIERLQAFARDNGGIEYAVDVMRRFQNEGEKILAVYPDSSSKRSFQDIFRFIIERTY